MDYNILLDATVELGYRLAMYGAETFRVEDSIKRIMLAYGIEAEVFAIPNCLHVSIETADRIPMTRMRRIGRHDINLDAVEKYTNLSRRICAERPEPIVILQWLKETAGAVRTYSLPVYLLGHILIACGFCIMFGGSFIDSLCSGLCGLVIGVVNMLIGKLRANHFFSIISSAFIMSLLAYFLAYCGVVHNVDTVIIGALMNLVPGLLFTNSMRDIIYGDTNSGLNRLVQVFLIAAAIALGTGAAWTATNALWSVSAGYTIVKHSLLIEAFASFVGSIGFAILFQIYGPGSALCALGGMITWLCYRLIFQISGSELAAYFWATLIAAIYAEIMARIRKYPAISYLVISAIPLIPGAGVYYTMMHAVRADLPKFAHQGLYTVAIAGVMAVGILLSSTIFRMATERLQKRGNT